MTGETATRAAGQVGGSDAVVRESGAEGLARDHRSSQGDILMDGHGDGTGLTGNLEGVEDVPWPWP